MTQSSNFSFLAEHDPVFLQLAAAAEQIFAADPNTTLIKLRQLGEALAQDIAARAGIEFTDETTQAELLSRLNREIRLDPTVRNLFHTLRIEGNKATHQFRTRHKEAMDGLKLARELAVWFHRAFGKSGAGFQAGPFTPPGDPSLALRELQREIEQLRGELSSKNDALETKQQLAALIAREKEEYAILATQMDAEARTYQSLAEEQAAILDRVKREFEQRLLALQSQIDKQNAQQIAQRTQSASQQLTHACGARPEKGKNRAIAEWPTQGRQAADYVLFAGLTPLAVVEAKRENANVAGKIAQAERYARGFPQSPAFRPAWLEEGRSAGWPDGLNGHFEIPFAYSSNSRPYLPQLAEQSGT